MAEEEARRKKAEEEEAERIRLEEERIEAERRAIEAEKERKKKAKQDKIDAQKAAGTYMTKAEKEKAKKAQARLEAMKAAGMLNVPGMTNKGDSEHSQPTRKVAAPKSSSAKTADTVPVKAIDESPSPAEESKDTEKLADDQEEEEEEDEWDNGGWELNLDKISAKVEVLKNKASEDVEDMIVLEKKKEQEKLKKIGIDRAKRDEELRIQR